MRSWRPGGEVITFGMDRQQAIDDLQGLHNYLTLFATFFGQNVLTYVDRDHRGI
jgi:hypothetical protein